MPRFVISTSGVDRAGDTIAPDGWRFDAFLKNPVVLWAHDSKALPVGKVTSITRTADSVVADIEFDTKDPLARQIAGKVADGLLSACSVGFRPLKWTRAESKDRPFGIDFHSCELLELSVVSVPANPDATVIARKSFFEGNAVVNKIMELRRQSADLSDAIDVQSTPELLNELAGIDAAIKSAEAEQARKAASAVRQAAQLGHPVEQASEKYSLSRLIKSVCDNQRCPEMDLSERVKGFFGAGNGFALPFVVEKTALAGVLNSGGALVPDVTTGLIDALLAPSLLNQLPSMERMSLTRGQGSIIIPRVNSTSTAAWVGEGNAANPAELVLGHIQLTPRDCVVYCRFSRLLMQTSSPAIDSILQSDMARALSTAIDTALLSGSGIANEPLGIIAQAGSTVVETEQANLWATLSAAVTAMDIENVPQSNRAWLINPTTAGRLRTEFRADPTDAIAGNLILSPGDGLLGIKIVVHSAVPSATALLIHQPDIMVASWGAMSAVIDPYTLAEQGIIRIVISHLIDIALRHSASVVKLTLAS